MQSQPKHSLHRGMRVTVTMGDGRLEPSAEDDIEQRRRHL